MSRSPLASSHTHQTRQQFAHPDEYLSYELGQAVKELPPLYTRFLAGGISLLVVGTLTWAYFSKVDEVAVANGKIVPSEQLRPVRTLSGGTIRAVHVEPGETVEQGEVLIERDPSITQAEVDRLQNTAQLIRADIARLEAERSGQQTAGTDFQDQLLAARLQEFDRRQAAALAEAEQQQAAIAEAQIRLTRLQQNLVNAKENLSHVALIEERMQQLSEVGAIGELSYVSAQRETTTQRDTVESLENDIAGQQEAIQQAERGYQAALQSSERLAAERQSEILARLGQRQEELANLEGQLAQAEKQRELETVLAPMAGTVYNVKATVGPVQSGEELLSILPAGEELVLEVKVLNRDIGFIAPGMRTKVKVATFPFQEFGTIDGEVLEVSPDAVVDEELGLVFPTKIRLERNSLQVRGETVELVPGMAATGEIVTRKKSILAFLIEPVARRVSEAFSVR